MITALAFALLQQPAVNYAAPPSGDTTGYWQQRASYTVVATLDEAARQLRAEATLVYVNNSPDTLREFYVHQYLNAFRPGSKWSEVDEREGRVRFQRLADPDHAYERFTAVPTFDGVPVQPEYPGAPDSTVVRFALPQPLPPGDTLRARFEWVARTSTLPRRQGRRGRSWDFAQWYPRVAVYDRRGWNPNPLVPAGEFYGEFGDWDVTLVLRDDQVLGTTGVVAEGDPGWEGALQWGMVARKPNAYRDLPPAPAAAVPAGFKRLRVVARDVHHFGWSVSPDYRYEGGYYLRAATPRPTRFRLWDSVSVHVLYRPGDEATWGRGQVVARTNTALGWLERIFGPYAYPQMTVLHRIEGGGTEFPMLQMNGSPSLGLNLHEGGHVYIHGILANNEWLAGWMDEGLSSYQTEWAQGLTRPEVAARGTARGARPVTDSGYAARALRPRPEFAELMGQTALVLDGWAQPLATPAQDYSEFGVYNQMVYGRGEMMFGALRDAIGDDAFRRFLRTFYDRWALRHVDEVALKAAAEAASGQELDWFFEQWIHRTGVVDYALDDVRTQREGPEWVTTARVVRQGDYRHPMPVGVRVDTGWVVVRAEAEPASQTVSIRTTSEPQAVELDPLELTTDWFAPNDQDVPFMRLHPATSRLVFDWPFLEQALGSRYLTAWRPMAWYSEPGGVTPAFRLRSSYQGAYDRRELGLALTTRLRRAEFPPVESPAAAEPRAASRFQGWIAWENPKLWGQGRPLMGVAAGVWHLDGVTLARLGRTWDRSRYMAHGPRVSHELRFTGSYPSDRALMDGRRWSGRAANDLTYRFTRAPLGSTGATFGVALTAGAATGGSAGGTDAYGRAEATWSVVRQASPAARLSHRARVYAGASLDAPVERGVFLSARTPTETFAQHWWRPAGAPLVAEGVPYIPLGGGGLRGYDALVDAGGVVALNLEEAVRVAQFGPANRRLQLQATLFADAGYRWARDDGPAIASDDRWVADAGVGLALRGRLYDRAIAWRVDLPLYVRQPALGVGERGRSGTPDRDPLALRVGFSFTDLW